MGTATPLEPTPAPVPASPGPRSPAEQAFARQVEERFAGLAGERNRFDILGLHLEATREQVKAAFLDLVKVFHPDRLPANLADLVSKATAVFDSLREAQDYLQDDERRAFHAREMASLASGRPLRDQAEAAEAYRAGEVALRRRDHSAAEAHFAEAYRLYPRAHVLAARAWAIYMDPNRKSDAAAARAMMVDALKEDSSCDRAHYQLGVIARVEGDVERAERHFREALKANPRHLESSQELRLIEMRKRGGPARKPR
jgi:curved DNA-binding protein CbpA